MTSLRRDKNAPDLQAAAYDTLEQMLKLNFDKGTYHVQVFSDKTAVVTVEVHGSPVRVEGKIGPVLNCLKALVPPKRTNTVPRDENDLGIF